MSDQRDGKILATFGFRGGQGRSALCHALARLFSEGGKKVLLVDADFESPGLSLSAALWGMSKDRLGFFDVLLDDMSINDVAVHVSDLLHFIPISIRASHRHEGLNTRSLGERLDEFCGMCAYEHSIETIRSRWARFITEARASYDVIILDARAGMSIGTGMIADDADVLLIFIGKTPQSIVGTGSVLANTRRPPSIATILVVSPADDLCDDLADDQELLSESPACKEGWSFHAATIPYAPVLAVSDDPSVYLRDEKLGPAYRSLHASISAMIWDALEVDSDLDG